jgi:hypothetical protein
MTHDDERLRHIRVLESHYQVEGNREIVAALREIEENLIVRIDDSTEETMTLVEIAFTRIDELREILHRLENKIDALALSLNGDHANSHPENPETGPSVRSCATSTNP